MSNKEKACGGRARGPGYGVQSMKTVEMLKFIKDNGTIAAKESLAGGLKSRGELCVILHSFRAGRELIKAGGGVSNNFRLTPSPNRAAAPAAVRARKAPQMFFRRGGKMVTARSGSNTNNNNIASLLNKVITNASALKVVPKPKPSYMEYQYGVRIMGKRPSGAQIKASLMRKKNVVGKGNSSNNNRSVRSRSGSASSGSSNRSANTPSSSNSGSTRSGNTGSASNRSGSNRSGSNRSGHAENTRQNLTAKRESKAKVRQTGSKKTLGKKNKYPRIKPQNKRMVHRGIKTNPVAFMNVPSTGSRNRRAPTRVGGRFTLGSRSKLTRNQLRLARNERDRRYGNTNHMNMNNNQKSALANKIMVEAIANVLSGKVTRK